VYALTGGRARSRGEDLNVETLVSTTPHGHGSLAYLRFEQAHIVRLCGRPTSIAEVAATLQVPLGVARVLVSDLHADRMLTIHQPAAAHGRPRTELLERLLSGLRKG
jgi:hypothetical protein